MFNQMYLCLRQEAGIAIGPILFVVAILAILGTAIAAGSSTFTANTNQETSRVNSAAIVQIGQGLKQGFDRVAGLGTPVASVDVNTSNTTGTTALFSAEGGGLLAPSDTLAATPATDDWIFSWGNMAGLGTSTLERLALLRVTQGVCEQLNTQAGITYTLAGVDYGTFSNTTNLTTTSLPAAFSGKMIGCIQNDNANNTFDGYYFYQVLAVQ